MLGRAVMTARMTLAAMRAVAAWVHFARTLLHEKPRNEIRSQMTEYGNSRHIQFSWQTLVYAYMYIPHFARIVYKLRRSVFPRGLEPRGSRNPGPKWVHAGFGC